VSPQQQALHTVAVGYQTGDALAFECDVLVLKYAQGFHGVDLAAARALESAGVAAEQLTPEVGRHILVPSKGAIKAKSVLLLGTPTLRTFGYGNIEELARRALEVLLLEAPETRDVGMTLHGPNLGLDVTECAQRQIFGIQSALRESRFPRRLQAVTIVERNPDRIEVLQSLLKNDGAHTFQPFRAEASEERGGVAVIAPVQDRVEVRRTFVYSSEPDAGQPGSVFVAMPFDKAMRTVWKYGIYQPVHEANLNCERMDEVHFTGDILDRMKALIERAELVIADITGNNPNVLIELGYAWGVHRPTLLLLQGEEALIDPKTLPFDVRTQRCLFYEDAVDLEEKLKALLTGLKLTRRG
jgi:hypothetical protein